MHSSDMHLCMLECFRVLLYSMINAL